MARTDEAKARARDMWARLAGVGSLEPFHVLVDRASPLGPPGWIAVLSLDGTITVSVPNGELVPIVTAALGGLTSDEVTRPDVVRARLPPTDDVRGPAALFYPSAGFRLDATAGAEAIPAHEVEAFLATLHDDDIDESGVHQITSPAFASRAHMGGLGAICGYRLWDNDVAHLSVVTHPDHRRQGHGRRAASAAIAHAIDAGLLPQWRARPAASQALARSLGLTEMGAQVCFRPAQPE